MGPWLRLSLVTASVTLLLMLLGWEVLEQQFFADESPKWVRYARWATSAAAIVIVLGLLAYRRSRNRTESLTYEVKRLGKELMATKTLLDNVVDAVPSSLLVVDDNRRLRMANAAAREIHGIGDIDLEGQPCDALSAPGTKRCDVCPGCETLSSREAKLATRELIEPRTGAVLSVSGHPVELPDGAPAALIVEKVITQQKKLQASLLHQEKMAAFGMVAAGVAHEMGNPLSAIEMHLQLLDETSLSDEDADSIQTLRKETARLRRTLRELVDFARRRRTEATLVSVQSVINDALRLIRFDTRMRNVTTRVEVDPETPPVFIVEDHLTQVMVNLIINAVDAMPKGGKLKVDARYIGKQVAIRVRDNGTGMMKATLERAFEPLYTTKEAGKGTGLGLSICRDVLQAADGTIDLHSAPDKGTTVVLTLPAQTADEHTSGPVRTPVALPVLQHRPPVSNKNAEIYSKPMSSYSSES